MIDKKTLLRLYYRGIIPGPKESEAHFLERTALYEECAKEPEPILNALQIQSCDLDIKPNFSDHTAPFHCDWLLVLRSDSKLNFWEGAATWLLEEGTQVIPVLQLKSSRLISTEELVRHEIVHIARANFREPIFEEILAYSRSASRFRRALGPLLRSPRQVRLWIMSWLVGVGVQWLLTWFWQPLWLTLLPLVLPIASTLCLIGSLLRDQLRFKRFCAHLETHYPTMIPLDLALLFTDREIIRGADHRGALFIEDDLRSRLFAALTEE